MIQIKEQTKEQKINMYSKLSKLQLIEMLIQANLEIDRMAIGIRNRQMSDVNMID